MPRLFSSKAPQSPRFGLWRTIAGIAFLAFGVAAYDPVYPKWWYLSLLIGVGVLALQFARSALLRSYALWCGLFLVLQTLISPWVVDRHFVTLLPNLNYIVDVVEGLPGISGPQRVTTDRLGFRTTLPVDYQGASTVRLFAVGASTTEQIFLDDERTFTHLLQERLSRETGLPVEVVNTGVSGLRARHHVATLKAIRELHPDFALILLGVNDWNHHIRSHFRKLGASAVRVKLPSWQATLRLRNTLLGRFSLHIQLSLESKDGYGEGEFRKEFGAYYTVQRNSLMRPDKRRFRPFHVSNDYRIWLERIMDECTAQVLGCVFATQPSGYRRGASADLKASFWMTPPNTDYALDFGSMVHIAALYNQYLIENAGLRGFAVCDVATSIAPSLENFYDDVHFNTLGAERMADVLLPCVLEELKRPGRE